MRVFRIAIVAGFICLQAAAQQAKVQLGGSSPADAFERLQKAAKVRDLPAFIAVLEADNRSTVLAAMTLLAIGALSGEVEGGVPAAPAAEKIAKLLGERIEPILKAHPFDPSKYPSLDRSSAPVALIGYAMTKMPMAQQMEIAYAVRDGLGDLKYNVIDQGWEAFAGQVPKGPLKLEPAKGTSVSGAAGGKALQFTRVDGRWYARVFNSQVTGVQ